MAVGTGRVTFWFGCNMLRHAEMIRLSILLLERVGYDVSAVGRSASSSARHTIINRELQATWRPVRLPASMTARKRTAAAS